MELNTWYTTRHRVTSIAGRIDYDPFTDSFTANVAVSGASDDPTFHYTQSASWTVAAGGRVRAAKFVNSHLRRTDW